MERNIWKDAAEKAVECEPGKEQDYWLRVLFRELVKMGYQIAGTEEPGILHFGRELNFDDKGNLRCDSCQARKGGKPIEDPMQGVLLRGWLLGADKPRDGNLTGYFMGCGTHMGPWVYCRECFERQMPWNQDPHKFEGKG
jgi:hypothetical protein